MYYVCYILSLGGLNVMPTSRNAKGIDIVAYSDSSRFTTIQVKSFSKPCAVPLGQSLNVNISDFWCIVYQKKDGIEVYVMKPEEILDRAHKDSKGSYWMEYKTFRGCSDFLNRTDRIVSETVIRHDS